jgi:hypothetical protein
MNEAMPLSSQQATSRWLGGRVTTVEGVATGKVLGSAGRRSPVAVFVVAVAATAFLRMIS